MQRGARWLAMAVIGVAAVAGLAPSRITAHASYDRSEPAADAVVRSAPERVDVWFTQEMFRREGENTISVVGPGGERVSDDVAVLDNEDRTHLSVAMLGRLGPGEYTVAWRTLSAVDGDTADGTFRFTVDPLAPVATAPRDAEAPNSAPAPRASAAEASSLVADGANRFPWWLLLAGAAVAASAALMVRAVRHSAGIEGPPE